MGEILPLTPLESLPLGYRFHPTDEELINHYLKRKINGRIKPCDAAVIPEVDVCRFEPWDLPDKSPIRSRDSEWFFFAPVDRKYPSGNRSNRSTEAGYWKSTGNDRMIKSKVGGGPTAALVGMKKTLVFYCGRAPMGTRTNWVMHEYRTVEPQGGFVLCRLFRKPEDVPPCSSNDEVQRTDFSSPNISSPGSLLIRANGVEESPTPLSRASPDSDLLEELQSLPEKIGKEMAGVNEVKQFIPHSSKPEEKQCINSMISDVGDHKGQTIGEELQSLPDIIGKEMSGINEVKRLTPHSFKLREKQCTSNMTSDVGDRKCQTIGEEQKGRTVEPFIHFSDPQIPTKKQTEPLNALTSLITARSSLSFSSPSKTLATLSSLRATHSLIGSLISQIEDLVKDRDKPMDDLGEEIEEEELKFIEKVEEEARECVLQSKRRVSPLCSDGRAADRGKGPSSADPLDRGQ